MKIYFPSVKLIASILIIAAAVLSAPLHATASAKPIVDLYLIQGYNTESALRIIPSKIRLELLSQGQESKNSFRGGQPVYVIPQSTGGFKRGEKLTWSLIAARIGRISADGNTIQNSWVTLPGETGTISALYQDRTNVFSGNLIALTSSGNVWRIDSLGSAQHVALIPRDLHGIATVADDPIRYGPWAGKIIIGDSAQGGVYAIDLQGAVEFSALGIQPQDLAIIPAQEDFYGIAAKNRELWHGEASEFAGMIGDALIAEKQTGILWSVRWSGTSFLKTKVAQGSDWQRILFFDENAPEELSRKVIVQHGSLYHDWIAKPYSC